MKFTHLHVHSHYSMLDGMSKIGDLIKKAKKNGMYAKVYRLQTAGVEDGQIPAEGASAERSAR